jgi:phospholipase/carboxylesterase
MMRRAIASALLGLSLAGSGTAAVAGGLTYLVHAPPTASAHPPLIVLLHGSGADERDMIGLWSQLPDTFVVVSPRAPFADSGGGYRWYRKDRRDADIGFSRKIVDLVVENAIKRFDVDPSRVFIGGFSQGAVMTYDLALQEPGRFRGAAVLSGVLMPIDQAALSARTDWSRASFFIAHGTADDRIPFKAATGAQAALAAHGVPTAFHAYPGMRHAVGGAETRDLSAWLGSRLATAPDASAK